MNELGLHGPKEPLDDGPKPWLRPGARLLRTVVLGQHTFKIHTVKFFAPINHQRLREAAIAADTNPYRHHAGTIAGGVKAHIHGEQTARIRINEKGRPRPPQGAATVRQEFDRSNESLVLP